MIGRRAKSTVPPEESPRSLAARLTSAQRRGVLGGVIIDTEGWGDNQELMLRLDGLDRAMIVKPGTLQLL
jgi:hypothetical protein